MNARYLRTVDPTDIPVAVDDVKQHLRVTTDDENGYIGSRIFDAVDWIERYLDHSLCTSTWKLYMDCFPGTSGTIYIAKYPVQSVSQISYFDTAGVSQVLASSVYELDSVSKPARVVPAYGQVWPQTRPKVNAVEVTFLAGYGAASAVPPTIKSAVMKYAAHLYEFREGDGKPPDAVMYLLAATGTRGHFE